MTPPTVRGVRGLLDGILSPTVLSSAEPVTVEPIATVPIRNDHAARSATVSPAFVRQGRPPRKQSADAAKEKITVRITSSLIAEYREWTWEARCQLSQLVERAMTHYRERRSEPR